MRIWSDSFEHRGEIPLEFAMGQADGFAGNRNPHLAWDGVPEGTKSFALLCIDPDVPTVAAMVGRADVQIPVEQPRTDFVHWAMADIAADVREIAAGSCSDGPVVRGKQSPAGPAGARHGLNDYTGWFAGDAQMEGNYFGYDGPCPPWNDSIRHRYVFTVFALDVAHLPLEGAFTGQQARNAMAGHILAQASITATYSLNPAVPA